MGSSLVHTLNILPYFMLHPKLFGSDLHKNCLVASKPLLPKALRGFSASVFFSCRSITRHMCDFLSFPNTAMYPLFSLLPSARNSSQICQHYQPPSAFFRPHFCSLNRTHENVLFLPDSDALLRREKQNIKCEKIRSFMKT